MGHGGEWHVEMLQRVQGLATTGEFEVEMGAGAAPTASDPADGLALGDTILRKNCNLREVGVNSPVALGVRYDHLAAVFLVPACRGDLSPCRGGDDGTVGAR